MRQMIFIVTAAVLLCICPAFAKDKKGDKTAKGKTQVGTAAELQAPAPQDKRQQEKDILISNITNMRNQEIRVAVLQQLLNEEIAKLRNVQAVFCGQYQLDVEKLRNGLYRYDEKEGKFIEQK